MLSLGGGRQEEEEEVQDDRVPLLVQSLQSSLVDYVGDVSVVNFKGLLKVSRSARIPVSCLTWKDSQMLQTMGQGLVEQV